MPVILGVPVSISWSAWAEVFVLGDKMIRIISAMPFRHPQQLLPNIRHGKAIAQKEGLILVALPAK